MQTPPASARWNGLKRSPMRKRAARRTAEDGLVIAGFRWPQHFMPESAWDGTLADWAMKLGGWRKTFHVYNSQRSESGWFDRVWLKPGHALFAELKVRDRAGKANRLSTEQRDFQAQGALAGLDVRAWTWPDDAVEAWETLTDRPWADCPYAVEVAL